MKIKNILSALVLSILACGSISLNNSKQDNNRLEVKDVMSENFSNFGGKTITPKRANEDLSQYFTVECKSTAGAGNHFAITPTNESYYFTQESLKEECTVSIGTVANFYTVGAFSPSRYEFNIVTGAEPDRTTTIIVYTTSGSFKFTFNVVGGIFTSHSIEAISVLPSASNVKVQQKYDSVSDTYSMRFVAGISSIELSKVSFNISITNLDEKTANKVVDVTSCYTSMMLNGVATPAENIFDSPKYTHIVAYAIEGIPSSAKNFTYNVYVELFDGENKVDTSETKSLKLNNIIPYTATFMLNDGTDEIVDTIIQYGTNNYSLPETPVREGYNFKGWNTKSDGSGETITSSTAVELQENTILYAIWEEKVEDQFYNSNITFNQNAAWFKYYLTWSDDKYDIRNYISTSSITKDNNIIASFSHTLDYCNIDIANNKLQYGFAFMGAGFLNEGTYALSVIVSTVQNEFYEITTVFQGANGGDAIINSTTINKLSTFKITLDYNDDETENGTIDALAGATIGTLPTPTREGYSFVCWNTSSDGTGDIVTSNSKFNEETTIYAIWESASTAAPYKSTINTAVNGAWLYYKLSWTDDNYDIKDIYSVSAIDNSIAFSHRLDEQTINNTDNYLKCGMAFGSAAFQGAINHTLTVIVETTDGKYYQIDTVFIGASGNNVDMVTVSTTVTETTV